MKRGDPYWKRLKSTDERVSIICGLEWMAGMECNSLGKWKSERLFKKLKKLGFLIENKLKTLIW